MDCIDPMKEGFPPSELNYVIYFKKGKAGIGFTGHIFTGELSRLDLARTLWQGAIFI